MPSAADLPTMLVAGRIDRARAGFEAAGIDALLVTDLTNVRYLTGFTGSAGRLLVRSTTPPQPPLLVTDGRYADQAADQVAGVGVDVKLEIALTLAEQDSILSDAVPTGTRLGLEAASVTWAAQRRYGDDPWRAELVATDDLVEDVRRSKDEGEVARLGRAAAIADAALGTVSAMLDDRPTEREVAFALEAEMHRLGAEGPSFDTIVASGPNGARPHHRAAERMIVEGDLVVIDFGALVDGYHSDMTRTFTVGDPSPTQRRMLGVVGEAQAAGVAEVRAGVGAAEVDSACRSVIDDAGWGEAFSHGTGHGVGLLIHEAPRLSRISKSTLSAGDVVTVEPGVYLPDHGGVRVEDTVVVTDEGCFPLTLAPKDPAGRAP